MDLDAYFARIGYRGPTEPVFETLDGVMRAHVAAIPFENIDVQLRRPVSNELPVIFDKLVTRRRGGWCYEQNGLLGWALQALGFDVMRLAGGVMRAAMGDVVVGNHLALIVQLEERWLVDAGFGGSLASPIRFAEGGRNEAPYDVSLARIDDGWWRFEEILSGNPFSFDFRDGPAEQALLDRQQQFLQTDEASPFVLNLVAQRRVGDTHITLRGRTFSLETADGIDKRLIEDAAELVALFKDRFGLDVPEIESCWPAICARHDAVFATAPAS